MQLGPPVQHRLTCAALAAAGIEPPADHSDDGQDGEGDELRLPAETERERYAAGQNRGDAEPENERARNENLDREQDQPEDEPVPDAEALDEFEGHASVPGVGGT